MSYFKPIMIKHEGVKIDLEARDNAFVQIIRFCITDYAAKAPECINIRLLSM